MITTRFTWILPLFAFCFEAMVLPLRASPVVDMEFEAIKTRAEQGDAYYQAALAFVFLHGEKGQPKSIDQFRDWTTKSAAQAHPLGLFAMGYLGKIDGDPEKSRRYYGRVFGPGESKLIKMAATGDALASYCLGELFVSNVLPNGIDQDTDLAALHFRVAADRGHQPSRVQYAVFRIKGWGVEKNEAEGFAMLLNVAEQNLPSAHYFLSHAYFEGWGVEKNDNKSLLHMVTAAELNYGRAQLKAAQFYAHAVASPTNWELASKYAGMASALGVPKAKELFEEYERNRLADKANSSQSPLGIHVPEPEETVSPHETQPPVSPEPVSPTPITPSVSANPSSKKALAQARDALRLNHDVKAAVIFYNTAAETGNLEAQRELGELYYEGSFVDRDYHLALKWFLKAGEAGDAPSQRYLGAMYFIGKGLPKDKQAAVKWLRLAAAQGDALAQEQLKMVERLLPR